MDKKKLIPIIAAVGVALIAVLIVTTIKNGSSIRQSQKKNGMYRYVEGYPDMSFAVPAATVRSASAISQISDTMDINKDNVYLYRDEDDYLLFSINRILIAAQRNTNFDIFNKEDKEAGIHDASVANIWFDKDGSRKFNYVSDKNFFRADVSAGLVITNEMYNDYVGQLGILNENGIEYSVFVGTPADSSTRFVKMDKKTQTYISEMVGSLTTEAPISAVVEEVYAISISSDTISHNEAPANVSSLDGTELKETETVSENNPSVSENEATEVIVVGDGDEPSSDEENKEDEPEVPGEPEEPAEKPETPEEPEQPEEPETPVEDPVEEPEALEETPEEIEEKPENPEKEGEEDTIDGRKRLKMNNQKSIEKEDNKAYTSNIYAMLKLKDNGIIELFDRDINEVVKPVIKVNRIYKGQTAVEMVQEFYKKDKMLNYFSPPVGCEWHIAEYKLSYAGCKSNPFVNVKVKGVDGNNLVFSGVPYSSRSYELGKEDGIIRCFYAVPVGCHEYALECGTSDTETPGVGNNAAYYHIQY